MIVKNISGFTMKCIAYRNSMDIDVEFLDGNCCIVKMYNGIILLEEK